MSELLDGVDVDSLSIKDCDALLAELERRRAVAKKTAVIIHSRRERLLAKQAVTERVAGMSQAEREAWAEALQTPQSQLAERELHEITPAGAGTISADSVASAEQFGHLGG